MSFRCDEKVALIVGGSPDGVALEVLDEAARSCDFVIAADSGGDLCVSAGVRVDVLVGDLDSISDAAFRDIERSGAAIARFDSDKDVTDLHLALTEAARRGCSRVLVVGVLGGRQDHQLCVWGDLARFVHLSPTVLSEDGSYHILGSAHTLEIPRPGTQVSLIALSGDVVVSESGMRWDLDREPLSLLDGRGLSNEVLEDGFVEVHSGTAAVLVSRS